MTELDLITIGRVSVDLYGQQIGSRLEDVATFARGVGGCPANVAIGAARLGLKAALITRVGAEPMGRFVQEQLLREGVDTRAVHVDPQRLTSLVLLSVRDEHSFPLIFYRENCADSALCEDDIDEAFIAGARAVLVTGTHFSLAGGARAQHKAMAAARAHGRAVILDIDYRPNLWGIGGHGGGESRYARGAHVTAALASVVPRCDLIVGTEEEIHIAAGVEDTLEALRGLRALSEAVIVVKRGPRGCVVFSGKIPVALEAGLVVPGLDIEVYIVLGAGDAFLAGFLKGFLRGASHEESARLANACGALAVSRLLCSSEFPTLPELEHLLACGSRHRALRQDPQLNQLHRATTRRPGPRLLQMLAPPGPDGCAALAIEALTRVKAQREGAGLLLGSAPGSPWPRDVGAVWARSVHEPGSDPLEFAGSASLAVELTEWPSELLVHCRCEHRPDVPGTWQASGRNLLRLAAVCRAQGRQWILELAGAAQPLRGAALSQVLSRLYRLDIRPDWWALEPQPDGAAWDECLRPVLQNDPFCRGVLVTLGDASRAAEALRVAAGAPLVRGFIAGGSIFTDLSTAWAAGRLSDAAAVARIAERFEALAGAWAMARDAELDPPQRSGS